MEPRDRRDESVGAIRAIDHVQVAMPAGGEPLASRFFVDLLGLRAVTKPPALASRGGAWFEAGSVRIHVGVDPDFRPARKAHVGLVIGDLEALAQQLGEAGFPIRWDDAIPNRRRCFTEDPFGNRWELMEPER